MPTPKMNWEISLGSILHAVVLLLGMGAIYGAFSAKFEDVSTKVSETRRQTQRIEHYLSSKDAGYWETTNKNGDPADGR